MLMPLATIALAAPIGVAGRPNRGGAYKAGSDGAAGVRRGSVGSRRGPGGPVETPWGRRGVPRGSVHQSCTDTGQSSDSSDDYKLRAALIGIHFCSGEN